MSTNVLYEANPTSILDGAEKTILGDDLGRPRVVVDALPPPSPAPPAGQLRLETGWAPLDYPTAFPDPIAVPGYLEYVSMRSDPQLDTNKTWYVLVLDQATAPMGGELAVETFGPLVNDDFDYWEPLNGWELTTGLCLVVSSTPVVYSPPIAPGPNDRFAYTIQFTPA